VAIAWIWLPAFGLTATEYAVTCTVGRSKEVERDVFVLKSEEPDGSLYTVIMGVKVPV
jgi:hypothetical protein